jgi:hypothetical protein
MEYFHQLVRVDIDKIGTGLLANDTGCLIAGYRFDLYNGAGTAACANFNNIISVSACTPGNSARLMQSSEKTYE